MSKFDDLLETMANNASANLFAEGSYRGHTLRLLVAPSYHAEDNWRLKIGLRTEVGGTERGLQFKSFTYETWEEAKDDFYELASEKNLTTYAPSTHLAEVENPKEEPITPESEYFQKLMDDVDELSEQQELP